MCCLTNSILHYWIALALCSFISNDPDSSLTYPTRLAQLCRVGSSNTMPAPTGDGQSNPIHNGHSYTNDNGDNGSDDNDNDNEPNPPIWSDSVLLIRSTDDMHQVQQRLQQTVQDAWDDTKQTFTSEYHFSNRRYAVLLAPGTYPGLNVQVGYYTQVLGLGQTPDDVQLIDADYGPFVLAMNKDAAAGQEWGSSLDAFWRGLENVYIRNRPQILFWAVSQAAPIRRVHVAGDVHLSEGAAYSSGGHMANCYIDGVVDRGSQQQFLFRHVHMGQRPIHGAWSMVYVGCTGTVPVATPGGSYQPSMTVVSQPAVRMEKPYLILKQDLIRYELRVPLPIREDYNNPHLLQGPLFDGSYEDTRDLVGVRVIRPDEPTSRIQQALDQGKDVILSPGIYELNETLQIHHAGQVLLGLGLATLSAPRDGSPCIHVAPFVPGVRIAGIMLEATARIPSIAYSGPYTLLEWGDPVINPQDPLEKDPGNASQPGGLWDIFCRVGGVLLPSGFHRTDISLDAMIRLHSGNIVADNLWLWRADHAALQPNELPNYPLISNRYWQSEAHEFRVETGLVVRGDNVTIFGLAVEHASGHQTIWSGEYGTVYFYQSELPYGALLDYAEQGYLGYWVQDSVRHHSLYGPGIYSNFRNAPVRMATAIRHPEGPNTGNTTNEYAAVDSSNRPGTSIRVVNPFIVKLDNMGGMDSIVNGRGGPTPDQPNGIPVRLVP